MRSSLAMFSGTLVSRILGFVRSPLILGAVLGINYPIASAYNIASKMPNILYLLLAGGIINSVLVPAIVKASTEHKDGGRSYINKLVTAAVTLLFFITLIIFVAAPWVVKIFGYTLDDNWFNVTLVIALWTLPQIFFYGIYAVIGQILNTRGSFGPYMWAPVINNLIAIAGLLLMLQIYGPITAADGTNTAAWTFWRVGILAGSNTLGIISQALILFIPLKRLNIHLQPDFRWRGSGLGEAVNTSIWVGIGLVINIFSAILLSNIAAGATQYALDNHKNVLQVAGNAAYSTAYLVSNLPSSLIVVSIVTAMYPRFSTYAAKHQARNLEKDFHKTIRLVCVPMFIFMTGTILIAEPAIRLIAPTVTTDEVIAISHVLLCLAAGMVTAGLNSVFTRTCYALNASKQWFFLTIPAFFGEIIGALLANFLLPYNYVIMGACCAYVACETVTVILLGRFLSVRLRQEYLIANRKSIYKPPVKYIGFAKVFITFFQLIFISVITFALGIIAKTLFGSLKQTLTLSLALKEFILLGLFISLVYVLLIRIFARANYELFAQPLFSRLRK